MIGGQAISRKRSAQGRSGGHVRKLRGLCAAVLCGVLLWPGAASAADTGNGGRNTRNIQHIQTGEEALNVQVTLHKSETVRVGVPFSEALVGNAEVADVVPLTNRSIYIVGKKVGVTRLALLDQGKQMIGVVDVEVTYDLDGLRRRLNTNPALGGVRVESVNGKILLTGVVPDAMAVQHAMTLAKQISADEVTNAMRVAAPQQVMLEVRFIEADRSAQRALGVNGAIVGDRAAGVTGVESFEGGIGTDSSGDFVNNLTNLASKGLVSNAIPFGTMIGRILAGGTSADIFIKALEERGLARRLAEPNLVALSGDTANFLAGGEFPFPASADEDKVSVEFKKFGIGLAFTPTVLSDGQINLKIEPEVSELDATKFITVANGVQIPSLVVRRASTTIELRDGQSFAIAGLLQSTHVKNQRQLPWLGDVPVIGALLRSAAWQKQETDLIIIVTPRLIKPRKPGGKLATPLDKSVPTNDPEFFLTGRQEIHHGQPDPQVGHILDLSDEAPVAGSWKGTIQ